jgi:hypothetical protein
MPPGEARPRQLPSKRPNSAIGWDRPTASSDWGLSQIPYRTKENFLGNTGLDFPSRNKKGTRSVGETDPWYILTMQSKPSEAGHVYLQSLCFSHCCLSCDFCSGVRIVMSFS